MSKCLLVGDPHLKVSNQLLATRFIDWLHKLVDDLKPDFVVNLGDTWHTHNVVRTEITALVDAHVTWMSQNCKAYFILVGNHDMAHHKSATIHSWLPYVGKFKNVKIIDRPVAIGSYGFMPYIHEPTVFESEFDMMRSCKTIFCHQTFIGANYGFFTSKDGVSVPEWNGLIVSGHVHKQQRMGCVWYPGTAYAQEAADHDELKGIFLLDTNTGTVDFYESPLPQWVTSRATPANYADVIAAMSLDNKNHLVIEGPGPEVTAAVDSKLFKDLKKQYGFSLKKQSTSTEKSKAILRKVATVEDAVVEYIDRIYDGTVDRARLKLKCLAALQ